MNNHKVNRTSDVEQWKPCMQPELKHIYVSSLGRVKNFRTGAIYEKTKAANARTFYVNVTELPEKGGKQRNMSVAKLVYEAFNNCILPPNTIVRYKSLDASDLRPTNLYVAGHVGIASEPTTIRNIEMPIPDANGNGVHPAPATVQDEKIAQWAKRYQLRMEDLHLGLTGCDEWQSLSDYERIGILDSELPYLVEDHLTTDDLVQLIKTFIRLLKAKE